MDRTIHLSSGKSYQGILIIHRDTMSPKLWVGSWANPDGIHSVGTEGQCSRKYFRTARNAVYTLARQYGIDPGTVPVMRGYQWNPNTVERGYRMQYAANAAKESHD